MDEPEDHDEGEYSPPDTTFVSGSVKTGWHRPRFRHDAPLWFTRLVFAAFVAVIVAAVLFGAVLSDRT
jgi:hypothetical protein